MAKQEGEAGGSIEAKSDLPKEKAKRKTRLFTFFDVPSAPTPKLVLGMVGWYERHGWGSPPGLFSDVNMSILING